MHQRSAIVSDRSWWQLALLPLLLLLGLVSTSVAPSRALPTSPPTIGPAGESGGHVRGASRHSGGAVLAEDQVEGQTHVRAAAPPDALIVDSDGRPNNSGSVSCFLRRADRLVAPFRLTIWARAPPSA